MPTVQEIADHLTGLVDVVSPSYALDIVKQACENLYEEREWGFLWTEGVLRIPALLSVGTVSVAKYSRNVTFSAALRAITDVLGVDDIPIANRQIKVNDFEIEYTIKSYDALTGIAELTDMYLGETNALASYQIYKRFYNPPSYTKFDGSVIIDFARFEAVVDLKNQYQLWVNGSNSWANSRDVARISEGEPFALIPHKEVYISGDETVMEYELYPVLKDSKERILKVLYIRKGTQLSPDEKFPSVFSKKLLIAAAENALWKWCAVNKGRFPSLQKTNWENMIVLNSRKDNENSYSNLLAKAEKRDEETFPQALQASYGSYSYALGYDDSRFELNGYYGLNETLVTPDGVGRFRF